MQQNQLRFGVHNFLNARPLVNSLRAKSDAAGFRLTTDVPAALADQLRDAQLDIAMIPAFEFLKQADAYRLVPGVCIASHGNVDTVLLLAKAPVPQITSVAVDYRSRTSVALLKILFPFSADVRFEPAAPDPESMLNAHDAALLIGDRALGYQPPAGIKVYDLSAEWFRKTAKTFVHAVVAVRPGVHVGQKILDVIQEVKREGIAGVDTVVESYVRETGADRELCADYLKKKIIYDLGDREMEGLLHFRDLCHEKNLIAEKFPIVLAR